VADSARGRLLAACAAPAVAVFAAFWLLPVARLALLPMQSGGAAYLQVLTQPRYIASLAQTLALSLGVTAATLALGVATGLYLGRATFAGRRFVLSLLTLPLSFPGVIIGFFVILLGGRQGLIASIGDWATGERWTFAYGFAGLFAGYIYFSLPRAIAAFAAAAESLDLALEDAARSLGASRWMIARDVWLPQLSHSMLACGAIVFATCMGAFGTAFTLASRWEVLPVTIYNEFTNYANFAVTAALSVVLGVVTWFVLYVARLSGPSVGAAA
jgi:putative spermidine/putrescine transport system permease protein